MSPRTYLRLPVLHQLRFLTFAVVVVLAVVLLAAWLSGHASGGWTVAAFVLAAVGVRDLVQRRHSVLRNYPILGHFRFLSESVRPELRQYFFESDTDGMPFSRQQRAIVYQRAKKELDKRPFGTQHDVYGTGYEWINHSLAPTQVVSHDFRVMVGGPACSASYSMSVFNISAMSFGSLSANAIEALNRGAKAGGFAPCDSLTSIILTCGSRAFAVNLSASKWPASSRQPK